MKQVNLWQMRQTTCGTVDIMKHKLREMSKTIELYKIIILHKAQNGYHSVFKLLFTELVT